MTLGAKAPGINTAPITKSETLKISCILISSKCRTVALGNSFFKKSILDKDFSNIVTSEPIPRAIKLAL